MKKILIGFLGLFLALSAFSQVEQHSKWTYEAAKKQVKSGENIDLVFHADVDNNWYMYSTDFDPNLGPVVTSFTFTPNSGYQLVGKIKPVGSKKKYDDIWGGDITYFTKKAEFRQTVKILKEDAVIEGSYEYQECSEVDGKCILHEGDFKFDGFKLIKTGAVEKNVPVNAKEKTNEEIPATAQTTDTATSKIALDSNNTSTIKEAGNQTKITPAKTSMERQVNSPYSLFTFTLVAFLSGLVALLTPCVFPMIPMTVTFFTSKTGSKSVAVRKALLYGFSIVAIYTVIGTVVASLNGPEFANWLSTHWIPNVLFFLIFMLFAFSFLGMFDITLPTSFVNKVDAQADKGGYLGVIFMAFTIVLVSFSCTGPIVGSILVESAGGQVVKPILGMLGFSLAFAIPFSLFAIFPEWLKDLPKSGSWLNSVKVVLGFLELALAFKFLSIADQVYHWRILDRDTFLVIWIAIFSMMGFYLLGKIKLPHDSDVQKLSVPRLMLAIVTFGFVIYLIPGLFGAPLKKLSGYLPPLANHDFDIPTMIRENTGGTQVAETGSGLCEKPKYAENLHFPHGIKGYFDYQQGIACARKLNKPVFIDFTGHGCVNCREMEANVWSDPEVLKRLKNDYVVIALYVDEKTELPESEWYTSAFDNKVKKTIGKQNSDLQITRFNNNAQPFYVLLDGSENLLLDPRAYDLSIDGFIDFLDKGTKNYAVKSKLQM